MSKEKEKPGGEKRRPKWWRRFWPPAIIACLVLIVAQCILYLLGYTDLLQLCFGILVVFVGIPLAYGVRYLQIRYQASKKIQLMNKIAFIVGFGWIAWCITFFGGVFIIWATGLPPPTHYLGAWSTFILLFVVPWPVGGYIGYRIGKRRNYRPFI
jgi:hypothetical protein